MKKILFLTAIVTILAFALAFAASDRIISAKSGVKLSDRAVMKNHRLISGDDLSLSNVPYVPADPNHIASSPGDTIGFSAFDYQSNGSSGNRIALDNLGGIHFAWMRAISAETPRTVYYNYMPGPNSSQNWPATGTAVSITGHENDGYCQIGLTTDNLAVVAYHNGVTDSLYTATDILTGFGGFSSGTFRFSMKFAGDIDACLWPYMTVDRNNRYHVIASEANPTAGAVQTLGYSRSTNGGSTWTTPSIVDTVMTISTVVTSSPVSDKVAIVYTHPYDTTTQWENDVYYILSQNGTTWDFRNGKVNVTGYETDSDSIWSYTDCDAVFDFNDDLHIVWSAFAVGSDSGLYFLTHIYHYDISSGNITKVMRSDSTWPETGCEFGGWNWTLAKMSIGVDSLTGGLFVTATSWYSDDCSAAGFANGELFMSYSTDNGANWTLRGDLTNSHTPACEAGECDSDHWSSLAEVVDSNLHLFYTNDLDAGGEPQTEGALTNNPMLYLHYPNPIRNEEIPAPPELMRVLATDTVNNGIYAFEWSEPLGAIHYEAQLANDSLFTDIFESDTNVPDNGFTNSDSIGDGTYYWRGKSVGYFGSSDYSEVYTITIVSGCDYVPGDINGNGSANGIDVTYGVTFLKGGAAPRDSCDCAPLSFPFYGGMDVNGSCSANGIDITFFVAYLKQLQPALLYCEDCPPR